MFYIQTTRKNAQLLYDYYYTGIKNGELELCGNKLELLDNKIKSSDSINQLFWLALHRYYIRFPLLGFRIDDVDIIQIDSDDVVIVKKCSNNLSKLANDIKKYLHKYNIFHYTTMICNFMAYTNKTWYILIDNNLNDYFDMLSKTSHKIEDNIVLISDKNDIILAKLYSNNPLFKLEYIRK